MQVAEFACSEPSELSRVIRESRLPGAAKLDVFATIATAEICPQAN
jgi:hypothetical protein